MRITNYDNISMLYQGTLMWNLGSLFNILHMSCFDPNMYIALTKKNQPMRMKDSVQACSKLQWNFKL